MCRHAVHKIPEVSVTLVWLSWNTTSDLGSTLYLDHLKMKTARNTEAFPTKPVKKAEKYWFYLAERRPKGETSTDFR